MANIKSAKKRIKIIEKKTLENKMVKSATKSAMKKVALAVNSGDKAASQEALLNAVRSIDKAASKGIYHKNNASHKKSRLTKMVNSLGV